MGIQLDTAEGLQAFHFQEFSCCGLAEDLEALSVQVARRRFFRPSAKGEQTRLDVKDRLHKLYQLLIQPVKEKLRGLQRLRIVTPPELAEVPWWGLRNGPGPEGKFLFESFVLSEVPAARALKSLEVLRNEEAPGPFQPGRPLLVGVSSFREEEDLDSLLDVDDELQRIAAFFPDGVSVLVEQAANRRAVLDALEDDATGVLHFSTHGHSELVLFNGERLTEKDLDAWKPRKKLVVFSACELAALGRSASVNGAAAVLSTVWAVADSVCPKLSQAFYYELFHQKQEADDALSYAMRWLLEHQQEAEVGFSDAELLHIVGFKLLMVPTQ